MRNILYAAAAAARPRVRTVHTRSRHSDGETGLRSGAPRAGVREPRQSHQAGHGPANRRSGELLHATTPCICPPGTVDYHQACQSTDTIPRTLPAREGQPWDHAPLPEPAPSTAAGPRCDPVHPTPGCAR